MNDDGIGSNKSYLKIIPKEMKLMTMMIEKVEKI